MVWITRAATNGVAKNYLGKLLEKLKTNLLRSLSSQLYLLNTKKKKEEVEET